MNKVVERTSVLQQKRSDDELVRDYLAGNPESFDKLYHRYRLPILRYFRRQLAAAQADDCCQETWFKLINSLPGYQFQGRLQAYLFSIAHNVLMDSFRRVMRKPEVSEDKVAFNEVAEEGSEVSQVVSKAQLQSLLYEQLLKLPVHQREVWLLRQETNLSVQEIAESTGSTVEGVKSRLRYANEKLKQGMQRYV